MTTATATRPMQWRQFSHRDSYWARAEQHKHETGSYPAWIFDFISIHDHHDGGFRLISPLCIVDAIDKSSSRPRWESKTFTTLGQAIAVAKRLARFYTHNLANRVHVVYCPSAR